MGKNKKRMVWLGLLLTLAMLVSLALPAAVPANPAVKVSIGPDPYPGLNYTANIPPYNPTTDDVALAAKVAVNVTDVYLALSAATSATTLTFTSPDANKFAAGDKLLLFDDVNTTGETVTVSAVNSATQITLTAGVTGSYPTANSARVTKTQSGLTFVSPGTSNFAAGDRLWLRDNVTTAGEMVVVSAVTSATQLTLTSAVVGNLETGAGYETAQAARVSETSLLKMYATGVQTANKLAAYEIALTYDPNVISIVSATGGTTTGFTSIFVVNLAYASNKVFITHQYSSGASGNVYFAKIDILGKGNPGQSSTIAITLDVFGDTTGAEIEPTTRTTQSGTVNIIGANFTTTTPFALAKGAAPLTVQFSDTSFGAISTWAWNFGDSASGAANTSTLQNPSHTYNSGGIYTVSLAGTWSTPAGFTHTATKTGYIKVIEAKFTASPLIGTAPLAVQFTDQSTGPTPSSWAWNFGDSASGASNTSTLQNPSHTYNSGGLYTVMLTVTNATESISDSETKTAYINVVVANFVGVPCHGAAPLAVQFTDQSTGSPNTWAWNFGDSASGASNTSTLQNPSHTYNSGGLYTVSLTATNSATGASDGETKTNYINVVEAKFTASPLIGTAPLAVQFTDQSTGSPNTWSWNFGDPDSGASNTSTAQNPSHTYTTGGIFTVSLTATNSTTGASDGETKTAYINAMEAKFEGAPVQGAAPLTVQFTDLSWGMPNTWSWNFGDLASGASNTSTSQNPSHIYASGGAFTVALTATNSTTGASDLETKTNYIKVVKADFTASPTTGMIPLTVQFTSTAVAPTGDTLTYSWDLNGDGAYGDSTSANPSREYTSSGDYTVSLRVTDTTLSVTSTETKTSYIHAMSIVARTSLTEELLSKSDVVRIKVNITDVVNPSTGLSQQVPSGIASYQATATYTGGKISMKAAQGVSPFDTLFTPATPADINPTLDASGQTVFNSMQTGSNIQAPRTLAKLVPILNSLATEAVTLTVDFETISDPTGANVPEDPSLPLASLSFRRGDANKDGEVSIVDALFIAQYVAALPIRPISSMGALNAASVFHDGTAGDKITIVDALYIAQYRAWLRNADYTPKF